jgi:Ca2+-binding RTX toxin-like protein
LAGGAARDFLLGYRGNDLLQGNGGGDYVNGGEGDDILIGGLGSDELFGEAGSDVFVFNVGYSVSGTIDTISDFRTGNDSIRIIDNSGNLTGIDLTTDVIGVSALANNTSADLTVTQAGSINTLITITNKSGGLLTINSSMVQMDVTMANGGNRTVVGGDLADTIRGGNGNDSISGGAGADNLTGGAGSDSLYGGDGNDTFLFDEGAGNRVVNAATVVGGDGIDTIYATNGNANGGVTLVSADFARVASMERLELLAYSTGQATVTLGSETNAAFSNGITIFLNESATAPLIVNGALSNVTVNATGSANHDSLTGGIGADNLMGGLGADTLTGGAGSDTIDVGAGSTDIVVVNAVQGITSDSGTALGSSGLDTVSNFNKDQDFFRVVISNISSFNVENAVGTDGFSYLVNLNGDADWTDIGDIVVIVNGAFGNDSVAAQRASIFNITGTASNDTIITGINNDTITGGGGVDVLSSGDGDNQFVYTALDELFSTTTTVALTDSITGGAGTDQIVLGGANLEWDITTTNSWSTRISAVEQIIAGGANTSSISVVLNNDAYEAGLRVVDLSADTNATGSNLISVSAESTAANGFVLIGSSGVDSITGGAGNDMIAGGAGNDMITGGYGADSLTGGLGADRFVFTSLGAKDIISDFNVSELDVMVFDRSDLGLGWQYSDGAPTILTVAQVNLLAAGAARNVIIQDTAANIAAFTNSGGQFANTSLALETDTGKLLFDLNSNYSSGIVEFVNVNASQAALAQAANFTFIA